jgi:hypothetical protein
MTYLHYYVCELTSISSANIYVQIFTYKVVRGKYVAICHRKIIVAIHSKIIVAIHRKICSQSCIDISSVNSTCNYYYLSCIWYVSTSYVLELYLIGEHQLFDMRAPAI